MPLTPEQIAAAGPWAVLVAVLLAVVVWLAREHLKADQDDRAQRDRALALLELAEQGNNVAAEAGKAMAAAWAERNRMDAARQRRQDKP